ncbi:MAG: DUF3426 domain-containing protein [Pseudomonadota bacterium]
MERLTTRCPHCNTAFRVTQEQLQSHQGQVRCGRCQQVFDAFAALGTLAPGEPPAQPPQEAETIEVVAEVAEVADIAEASEAGTQTQPVETEAAPTMLAEPGRASGTTPNFLLDYGSAPPTLHGKSHAGLWAMASLLLLCVLVAQGAYFFRSELAARYEPLRPMLASYCEWLQCKVELPKPQQQLDIAASDLQAENAEQPNRIVLSAVLRNHATTAVAYPALELTLTDPQDRTVARRVFLPGEYLQQAADPLAGLGAGAEASVQLHLDTGDVAAAGYRLYLFYP